MGANTSGVLVAGAVVAGLLGTCALAYFCLTCECRIGRIVVRLDGANGPKQRYQRVDQEGADAEAGPDSPKMVGGEGADANANANADATARAPRRPAERAGPRPAATAAAPVRIPAATAADDAPDSEAINNLAAALSGGKKAAVEAREPAAVSVEVPQTTTTTTAPLSAKEDGPAA